MEDKNKAATIAKALNSAYYHHGYAVGRTEAKEIGLNIVCPETDLEELMWSIWCDYSSEMQCGREFNPVTAIMENPDAKAKASSIPVVNLPANVPPQLAQGILANMLQQNLQISQQTPIEITETIASLESIRKAVAVSTTFSVQYWRDANMALSVNATTFSKGWQPITKENAE